MTAVHPSEDLPSRIAQHIAAGEKLAAGCEMGEHLAWEAKAQALLAEAGISAVYGAALTKAGRPGVEAYGLRASDNEARSRSYLGKRIRNQLPVLTTALAEVNARLPQVTSGAQSAKRRLSLPRPVRKLGRIVVEAIVTAVVGVVVKLLGR